MKTTFSRTKKFTRLVVFFVGQKIRRLFSNPSNQMNQILRTSNSGFVNLRGIQFTNSPKLRPAVRMPLKRKKGTTAQEIEIVQAEVRQFMSRAFHIPKSFLSSE